MECFGGVYVRCKSKVQCDRLAFYADSDTRPDFESEVPEEEAELFEVFENELTVGELNRIDDRTLVMWIDDAEGSDEFEFFVSSAALFDPETIYYYFGTDGEENSFYHYQDGEITFLFNLQSVMGPGEEDDPDDFPSDETILSDPSAINLTQISLELAREVAAKEAEQDALAALHLLAQRIDQG